MLICTRMRCCLNKVFANLGITEEDLLSTEVRGQTREVRSQKFDSQKQDIGNAALLSLLL